MICQDIASHMTYTCLIDDNRVNKAHVTKAFDNLFRRRMPVRYNRKENDCFVTFLHLEIWNY